MSRDLTAAQRHLLSDAEAIWAQQLPSLRLAASSAGGMQWKQAKGRDYLIRHWNDRVSGKKRSVSLGVRTPKTERLYAAFLSNRRQADEATSAIEAELSDFREMVKALRLPRLPSVVTDVMRWFAIAGIDRELAICSHHVLFAYGANGGVQFDASRGDLGALELLVVGHDLDGMQDGLAEAVFSAARGARYEHDRFIVERAAGDVAIIPRSINQVLFHLRSAQRWDERREEVLREAFELDPILSVCIGDDGGPTPMTAVHPKALLCLAISLDNDPALTEELSEFALDQQIPFDAHEFEAFPELGLLLGDPSEESPRF
jgi:hypothetical protein